MPLPEPPRAPLRICFVAPKAHTILAGVRAGPGGGAEVQQVLLAHELRRRGLAVSFVCGPAGPRTVSAGEFRVHWTCAGSAGLPGLRFVHPRWTSLWAALHRADADVYYQRGNGAETGQVALWSRLRRRAFVFAAASDSNVDPALPDLAGRRERWLYRWGLRHATRVVCQTRMQQQALHDHFGCAATLIRSCGLNPGEGRECAEAPADAPRPRETILWVGRITPKKRPEWVLELAQRRPEWPFEVVADLDTDAGRAFQAAAARLPNVRLRRSVPWSEIGTCYAQAAALLCTSHTEGFPNTFVEAWARGIPVVSSVDPDGLIARHGLGLTGATLPALEAGLGELRAYPALRTACGERARAHFLREHAVTAAGDAYAALFLEAARAVAGPRRRAPAHWEGSVAGGVPCTARE